MSQRSLPRRAAIFAASLGATAIVGVAPALATTVPGENIFGSGSSLQKIAQQNVWTAKWSTTPADQLTLTPPLLTAVYTSSSSGHGLAEFGNTTGTLDLTQDTTADNGSTNGFGVPVLDAYIGTDDPPTGPLTTSGTNLFEASAAATGSATTAIDEITVPVAQAPVALLISLPVGITAGGSSQLKLTNALVVDIYDDTVPSSTHYAARTWGALLENAGWKLVTTPPAANQFKDPNGTGGNHPIILQVRSSPSGTTYNQQGFLQLSGAPGYQSPFVVSDNDIWPVATVNTGNSGGSQLVADTTATPGSIGYANLADAQAGAPAYTNKVTSTTTGGTHQIVYAFVQSNEGGKLPIYADPQGATAGSANVYNGTNININGANPTWVGHWNVPLSGSTLDPTGSWGGTQPSDPDVYDHDITSTGTKVDYYPIVAATYVIAWSDYDETGSNLVGNYGGTPAKATAAGNTAISFVKYLVGTGQVDLANAKKSYSKVPTKIVTYARTAAGKITP